MKKKSRRREYREGREFSGSVFRKALCRWQCITHSVGVVGINESKSGRGRSVLHHRSHAVN